MDLNQVKNAWHEQCNNALWCRIGYSGNLLWNHSWAIGQSQPPIMSHFLLVYEIRDNEEDLLRSNQLLWRVNLYFDTHLLRKCVKRLKGHYELSWESFCLFFDKGALCHFAIFAQRRSDKFRRFEQNPRQIIDQNTNRSSLAIKRCIGKHPVMISDKDTSLF